MQLKRLLPRLLAAFVAWSAVAYLVLPLYMAGVVPATSVLVDLLPSHGAAVKLASQHPWVGCTIQKGDSPAAVEQVSSLVLTYNALIYLALLTAATGLDWRQRGRMAAFGMPCLFVFHIVDLGLTVQSRVLSIVAGQHYDFRQHFGLWFTVVKVYSFLSLMALKQALPLVLFYAQWRRVKEKVLAAGGTGSGPS